MTYAGEHNSKKLVRCHLYATAARFVPRLKGAWAVTITGPEACEAGCLKHILRWPAEQTMFVDTQKGSAAVAEEKFPGCIALEGDICDALDLIGDDRIAFIHLDLMGHPGPLAQKALDMVRGKLARGAVVAFTYFRGREKELPLYERWTPNRISSKWMRTMMRFDEQLGRDWRRTVGTVYLVAALIGAPFDMDGRRRKGRRSPYEILSKPVTARYLGTLDYQTSSPMSCVVMQWNPLPGQNYKRIRSFSDNSAPLKDRVCEAIVKRVAADCSKRGMPNKVVAEVFDVSHRRVAAWVAHWTQGHNFTGNAIVAPGEGELLLEKKRLVGGGRAVGLKRVLPNFGAAEGRLRSLAKALVEGYGIKRTKSPKPPKQYTKANLFIEQLRSARISGERPVVRQRGRLKFKRTVLERINEKREIYLPEEKTSKAS